MTNPQNTIEPDPLESYESVPAVSFHAPNGGHPIGEVVELKVLEYPKLLDQRDDNKKVITWDDGNPKKVLVLAVEEKQPDGSFEKKSLWAKQIRKGKGLFVALMTAQKAAREKAGDPTIRIKPGDTLFVKYIGDDTSVPAKMGNHPKMFQAVLRPGAPLAPANDPFNEPVQQQPAAAAQPASDPWNASAPAGADSSPFGPVDAFEGEPPF